MTEINQDPYEWNEIYVLTKEPKELQTVLVDDTFHPPRTYNIWVCEDSTYTKQLSAWTASLTVDRQSTGQACCELIVQADDEQVRLEMKLNLLHCSGTSKYHILYFQFSNLKLLCN